MNKVHKVVKTDTMLVCVEREAITRGITHAAFKSNGIMSFRLENKTHCRFCVYRKKSHTGTFVDFDFYTKKETV